MKKPKRKHAAAQRADRPIASVDRAALHEEIRFTKRQQWAVTAAGLALLGGILTAVPSLRPLLPNEKLAGLILVVAIPFGCAFFLFQLHGHLREVRLNIDPDDPSPLTRGLWTGIAFMTALIVGAAIVGYALFRDPPISPFMLH